MNKTFLFQNRKIQYRIEGNGPVLVLLHGFLESSLIWSDFIENLKYSFTIIAIDLPGHGMSDSLDGIHSMDIQSQLIHEILEEEKINRVMIAGHSMGGYIAADFCERFEPMVCGLVLFHSHAAPDSEEVRKNRNRLIRIVRENKVSFIMQFIPGLFDPRHVNNYQSQIQSLQSNAMHMTPEGIIASIRGMRNRNGSLRYLAGTVKPVLFIVGKQDSRMPFKQLLEQAELPAHSEVLLLEGVSHMGYIEAPVKTLEALRHFAFRCFGV
jgi:pimeloyl-ACP methyl ester carboxylesterase